MYPKNKKTGTCTINDNDYHLHIDNIYKKYWYIKLIHVPYIPNLNGMNLKSKHE